MARFASRTVTVSYDEKPGIQRWLKNARRRPYPQHASPTRTTNTNAGTVSLLRLSTGMVTEIVSETHKSKLH